MARLGRPRWTLTGLPSNIVQVIEIGFLLLGFAGSLVLTPWSGTRGLPRISPCARSFHGQQSALVLWVASMWLMFQPMEMRAMLMSG